MEVKWRKVEEEMRWIIFFPFHFKCLHQFSNLPGCDSFFPKISKSICIGKKSHFVIASWEFSFESLTLNEENQITTWFNFIKWNFLICAVEIHEKHPRKFYLRRRRRRRTRRRRRQKSLWDEKWSRSCEVAIKTDVTHFTTIKTQGRKNQSAELYDSMEMSRFC